MGSYTYDEITWYIYDANGQLVKETTLLGNRTTYQYDALGSAILRL